jgi:hypothetical protein
MLCLRRRIVMHNPNRRSPVAQGGVRGALRLLPTTYTRSKRVLTACALLALCAAGFVTAKPKTPATPVIFQKDKGKFVVQVDGHTVAHEDFEIAPNGAGWVAKGVTELKVPQTPPSTVSGTLTLQPDGTPISYEWTAQAEKTNGAHILFANGIAKVTLEMQGARPFEQDMSFNTPLVAILDNNLYHQYAVLARLYDWQKRGPQTFPVLIPQELTPGSITVEATGPASVAGKDYEALHATTSDLEVFLYLDKDHRLERVEVPSAKASIVRE